MGPFLFFLFLLYGMVFFFFFFFPIAIAGGHPVFRVRSIGIGAWRFAFHFFCFLFVVLGATRGLHSTPGGQQMTQRPG